MRSIGIERRQQPALDAVVGRRRAAIVMSWQAVEGFRVDDSPAVAACADEFADVKNLHRSIDGVVAKNAASIDGPSESACSIASLATA